MDKLGLAMRRRDLVAMDAVEKGARGGGAIGVLVGQGRAVILGIPAFAGDHAGMTADASVEVDHKAKLALGCLGQAGHGCTPRLVVRKSARSAAKRSGSSTNGAWPIPS